MGQESSVHSNSGSLSSRIPSKRLRQRTFFGPKPKDNPALSYRKTKLVLKVADGSPATSIEDSFWSVISDVDDDRLVPACAASFIPPMETADSNRSLSSVSSASSTSSSILSKTHTRRDSISMLTGLFKQQLQYTGSETRESSLVKVRHGFTTDYLGLFDLPFLSHSVRLFRDICFGSRVSVDSQKNFLIIMKTELNKRGYIDVKCPSLSNWKRFLCQLVSALTKAADDSDEHTSEIPRIECRNQAVHLILEHIQHQWSVGESGGIMQWQCAFSSASEAVFSRRFSMAMQYSWDCLSSGTHSLSRSLESAKQACFGGGGLSRHCMALADVRDDLKRGLRSSLDFISLIESGSPALLYLSRWLRLSHFPECARLVRFFHVYQRLQSDDSRKVELFGDVAEHIAKDSECAEVAELPPSCHECFAIAMLEYEETTVLPLSNHGVSSVDLIACMAGVFERIEKKDETLEGDRSVLLSDELLTLDCDRRSSSHSKGHYLITKLVKQLGMMPMKEDRKCQV